MMASMSGGFVLRIFLRTQGLDARLDLPAADQPQDWSMWMLGEVKAADFVLLVASPVDRLAG